MNLKLTNIHPDDYILAVRAAKSFILEDKPVGIRHGSVYSYSQNTTDWMDISCKTYYCYRTKTMVVVRKSE